MPSKMRGCEICKGWIEAERLEAQPETRLCSEHAKRIVKYGGEFIVTSSRASLGKAGSLKKNYGDITIEKQRNQLALDKLRQDYRAEKEAQG